MCQLLQSKLFLCGATLIAPDFAITAAYCLRDHNIEELTLLCGTEIRENAGVLRTVVKAALPCTFDKHSNNVVVLKLEYSMHGENIMPIDVCDAAPKKGDKLQITGWGSPDSKPTAGAALKTSVVSPLSNECCTPPVGGTPIAKNALCLSGSVTDAATNDVGGPAILNNKVCGIIPADLKMGKAGFYVNVFEAKSFIVQAMMSMK